MACRLKPLTIATIPTSVTSATVFLAIHPIDMPCHLTKPASQRGVKAGRRSFKGHLTMNLQPGTKRLLFDIRWIHTNAPSIRTVGTLNRRDQQCPPASQARRRTTKTSYEAESQSLRPSFICDFCSLSTRLGTIPVSSLETYPLSLATCASMLSLAAHTSYHQCSP